MRTTAADIPWKTPAYTLVARDMDLRTALDTFAVAEGLSVVMSPAVGGLFSGDFKDAPPAEFLDKLATTHNLVWYYDGAALYLYGAGEIQTMLIDLRYMKAGEVRDMLAELGVEDSRFPLKTTSNDELVMVSGPPRYVSLVEEMVSKADKLREQRTFTEVEARIFPLTYTWADDVNFSVSSPESSAQIKGVATLLKEIMDGSVNLALEAIPPEERAKAEAVRNSGLKPMIRAENRLNAVIVRDSTARMPMYSNLIEKLDVPQKLVEIDVTTVEMSQKNALDWQLSVGGTGTRGRNSVGVGMNAGNSFGVEDVAGQGLAGALTHLGSHYDLGASLTALREKGKARSISRTQLLTVNNLAAEMTDQQSYHAKVVGTEVATLQEVSAGTTLQIKPRILPALSTNIPSQVWLSLQLDDGGFEAITVDAMPMKRSSSLTTQTAVFDEESIMLAGYLRDIVEDGGWGIPFLRDIPVIGWLFGGKSSHKETVQRIFVVTPHIVDLDAESLARLQATRLRDISIGEEIQ
ncbi:MAG: type III secretion system outer membrane ring subunit SctC, partial [Kiritimatiellae bacterium]|nr:type III secretion system outer membrane ring subunit SctC [Kiritimatiellia bacterium]